MAAPAASAGLLAVPLLLMALSWGAAAKEYNTTLTFTIPSRIYPNMYQLSMRCRIDDLPPSDEVDYRPRFFKLVNGKKHLLAHARGARIAPYEHYTYSVHHNDYYGYRHVEATLTIERPRAEDTGTIGCDVPDLNMEKTDTILIPDFGDMSFTIDGEKMNSTLYVVPGQKNVISCQVNGTYPPPELRFFLGKSNLTTQANFTIETDDEASNDEEMKEFGFHVQRYKATLSMELEFTEMSSMRYLKCIEDIEGTDNSAQTHTLVFVDGVDPAEIHNTTMKLSSRYGENIGSWGYLMCEVDDLPHELLEGWKKLDITFFRIVEGDPWPIFRIERRLNSPAPPFNNVRSYRTYSANRRTHEYGDHVGSKLTRQMNLGSVNQDQIGTYMCSLLDVSGRTPVILRNSSYFNYTVEAPPKDIKIYLNDMAVTRGNTGMMLNLYSGQNLDLKLTGSGGYVTKVGAFLGGNNGINVSDRFQVDTVSYPKNSTRYPGVTITVMNITITPKKKILVKPSFASQTFLIRLGNQATNLIMDVAGGETEPKQGLVWIEPSVTHYAYKGNPVIISCHVTPLQLQLYYHLYPVTIKWVKVIGSQEVPIAVNNALHPGLTVEQRLKYKPFVEYRADRHNPETPVYKLLITAVTTEDNAVFKCVAPQMNKEDSESVKVFGASSNQPIIVGIHRFGRGMYVEHLNETVELTFYMNNIASIERAKVFKDNGRNREEISLTGGRVSLTNMTYTQAILSIKDAVASDSGHYILSVAGVESNPVLVTVVEPPPRYFTSNYLDNLYMNMTYHGEDVVAWEDDPAGGFSVYCWHNSMIPGMLVVWQREVEGQAPWLGYDNQLILPTQGLDRYNISYQRPIDITSDFRRRGHFGSNLDLVMDVSAARVEDHGRVYCSVPGTPLSKWVDVKVARAPERVSMFASFDETNIELKDGQVLEVPPDTSVHLECSAAGFYPEYIPSVFIQRKNVSEDFQPRLSRTVDGPTSEYFPRRMLYSASRENTMKFDKTLHGQLITCDASVPNTKRNTNSTTGVWVRITGEGPSPEIKMTAVNVQDISLGRNITLQCDVTGLPYQVPIQWRREVGGGRPVEYIVESGKIIHTNSSMGRYNLTSRVESSTAISYNLTITDLRDADYGRIFCEIPGLSVNSVVSLRPKKPQAQTSTKADASNLLSSMALSTVALFALLIFKMC